MNYRCSKRILDSAMKVIGRNKTRFQKELSTPNQEGEPVRLCEYANPREEYLSVTAELRKRLEQGENLENTAVLLRTNQEAEGADRRVNTRSSVMKEKLPNLFQHWICRNLLAYMRFAQGERSRNFFWRS